MKLMLIDSHAHLFGEEFKEDMGAVLQRARDAGVERIVVPGTTLETSREAIELADRYSFVYAAVGYHPHEATKASDVLLMEIEGLSRHPKVVAIGEVGLDYYYDFAPKEVQQSVFKAQMEIAARRNLPVIVHTRDSMAEAISLVSEFVEKHPFWCRDQESDGAGARGVFHCFAGDEEQARQLFALGFYVSYPGIVTFKKSPVLETLRLIGLDRLLIETDSPYLSPVPFRGKRNEPSYLPLIAQKVAEVLELPVQTVAEKTTMNAEMLFSMQTSSVREDAH